MGLKTSTRRAFLTGGLGLTALAACGNGIGSTGGDQIDASADAALNFLYGTAPGTRDLADKASGVLIMPQITQAGFGLGGGFGRGVLRIDDISVDYYSAAQASIGLQLGAQQYSQVLFFMTDAALAEFRQSDGWSAGAGARYAMNDDGAAIGLDINEVLFPVEAVVFATSGLIAGATIEGTKYTRIIP